MGDLDGAVPVIAAWDRLLETRVSGRPLALTRLAVAVAALVWLHGLSGRFSAGFAVGQLHLGWPVIGDRLIGLAPAVPWTLWAVGAVVLASGVWARAGAASLALGVALFLAADRQHYANGTYLLLLVAVLLVFADTGASWTPWGPDRRRTSWWPAFLLASQLSIVYGYAALHKFRPEALRGETVDWQLRGPAADLISWSGFPSVLNTLGGMAELFCAIGLWFAVTRRWAVVVGIVLHLGILVFMRDSPGLLAFSLVSVGLYPAFWCAAPPLAAALRRFRTPEPATTPHPSPRPS